MPIISHNPAPPPPKPEIDVKPRTMAESMQSCIVDLKDPNLGLLATSIGGYRLKGDYYSQVLGEHDAPSVFDMLQSPVYQQYQRIRNFELFLDGSLNQSSTPESTEFTIDGSGTMMPGLIPNVGDVFVFDLGNGNIALSSVTAVERLSYFTQAAHKVQIKVTRYLTPDMQTNLDQKVVKEYVYSTENLALGVTPIITPEEFDDRAVLTQMKKDVIEAFIAEFYDVEINTFLVGGSTEPTYDPFAIRAWFSMVSTDAHPIMAKAIPLNCSDYELAHVKSVWDALILQNPAMLRLAFSKAGLFHVKRFNSRPLLRSVRFSKVRFVVVPRPEGFGIHKPVRNYPIPEGLSLALAVPDGHTAHYVLSEAFYEDNAALMTPRDKLVSNAITGAPNERALLQSLYSSAKIADPYTRFYDYLLLIALITVEIGCE